MVKICFYVPGEALEVVKEAAFAAGGGHIGNYDRCCWQTEGLGQFRPLPDSNPSTGTHGEVKIEKEWRVELVCKNDLAKQVVQAIVQAHPYEEVACDVMKLEVIE